MSSVRARAPGRYAADSEMVFSCRSRIWVFRRRWRPDQLKQLGGWFDQRKLDITARMKYRRYKRTWEECEIVQKSCSTMSFEFGGDIGKTHTMHIGSISAQDGHVNVIPCRFRRRLSTSFRSYFVSPKEWKHMFFLHVNKSIMWYWMWINQKTWHKKDYTCPRELLAPTGALYVDICHKMQYAEWTEESQEPTLKRSRGGNSAE